MRTELPFLVLLLGACIPEAAQYKGRDDPRDDHDGDGQTELDGDCAPYDAFVWDGAPEYCDGRFNGCDSNGDNVDPTWTVEAELGKVTQVSPDNIPTDITDDWAAGTATSPLDVHIDAPATIRVCPGIQHVSLQIDSDGVHLEGLPLPDHDPPTLSGGTRAPVLQVATEDGLTTVANLSLVDGASDTPGVAGGITVTSGDLHLNDAVLTGHVGLDGGALTVHGHASLARVYFELNQVTFTGSGGGAVHVSEQGALDADSINVVQCNTHAADREDPDAPKGGGLLNLGQATVRRSTFEAGQTVHGGAIANVGWLDLQDSVIRDNFAADGGGLWTAPGSSSTLTGVTVSGNRATLTGSCGGIYNAGTMTILTSDLVDNWAAEFGGGVYIARDAVLTAEEVLVASNYAFEGGNITSEGLSTWEDGAILAGLAHAGGGLYGAEFSHTTLTEVAVWSNSIRLEDLDDLGDEGRGGGAVLLRGSVFECYADGATFRGPDLEPGPVFGNNQSEHHIAGGVMLADSHTVEDTVFRSFGCYFGADSKANDGAPLYAGFTHNLYDVAGLESDIVCSRSECICGDLGPCPPYTPPEDE